MDMLLVLLVVGLMIAIVLAVTGAKDMQELGLVLIVLGLFLGWPVMAIGAALMIAHHYKCGNRRE